MTNTIIGLLTVIVIYLIAMVLIGVYFSSKNKDVSDFYLRAAARSPVIIRPRTPTGI